jgi:2-desacetyl-2-hydroxyethyl bacteriochlorophyllide A dehydrogenase
MARAAGQRKKMLAALLRRPLDLQPKRIPVFELDEDQVMLRVAACGICGSDLRYYHGENPWALHTLGKSLPNPPNIVLGHEFSGAVEDAGKFPALRGKRVAVLSFETCGECDLCNSGRENLCKNTKHLGHGAGWGKRRYYPGGMAERCPVWGKSCFLMPDEMTFEEAALLDVVGVGVHAARGAGVTPGSSVVVYGAGPIGNAIMQASRAFGAGKTFVVDTYNVALEVAKKCGATAAIKADAAAPVESVREMNRGNCSFVFDTVGTVETLRNCVNLLAEGGQLTVMAVHDLPFQLNALELGSERVIRTSCNFRREDFPLSMNLLSSGQINVKPWITHRFELSKVNEAFETAFHKEDAGAFKIIIYPQPR